MNGVSDRATSQFLFNGIVHPHDRFAETAAFYHRHPNRVLLID